MSSFYHDVLASLTLKITCQFYLHFCRQLCYEICLKSLIPCSQQCEIQIGLHRSCAFPNDCVSFLPQTQYCSD